MEQSVVTISKSGPYDQTPTRMVVYEIPYTVYIISSALVSMFCCPLVGVPGIFVSLEVKKRVEMGDIHGAQRWAIAAKFCIGAALVIGTVLYIVFCVFNFR